MPLTMRSDDGFTKRLLAMFIASVFFLPGFAQRIKVIDAATSETIPGAQVWLTNTGNAKVRRAVTGISGEAVFPVSDTIQLLELRMLGYLPFRDTLPAGCLSADCRMIFSADSLRTVVITAQYGQVQPDDAVQPVRIIDREKIDAMGAQNLRELLTNETNIRLAQDPVLGSSMNLQGLSGENVKILVDGIPVIGRQNGNIDLSQIPLANIERVEIIEGPQSVSYGTNALAGVINLVTAKRQAQRFSAGAEVFYESSGQYNSLFRAGVQQKRTIILVSADRNYFDGWSEGHAPFRYEKPHIADSSRVMQWKPRMQYFGTVQLIRNLDRGQFGFSSDFFNEKIVNRGEPRAPYGETAFDDYYRTQRWSNTFYARFRLADENRIDMQAAANYYRRRKNTWFKDLTTLEQQLVEDASLQDTAVSQLYLLRALYTHSGDSLRFSYEAGIHAEYESATGARISDHFRAIGDYAVFASAEYIPVKWLVLRPGFRWSYNTGYRSQPSPSLNALLRFGKNWKLRLSCARGFRSPSLKELYFYFVDINHNIAGNEELRAEHSDNYMGTLTAKWQTEKSSCHFDLAGFYNDLFNLITLALLQGTEYSYVNIGRSKTAGVSVAAGFRFRSVKAAGSFVYAARSNELAGEQATPAFSWSPEARGSLLWEEKKSRISGGVFVKYTGRLPQFIADEQGGVSQVYTGSYTTIDFSFSRKFAKEKWTLEAGCRNLLDVRAIPTAAGSSVHSVSGGSMLIANGRNYFICLRFHLDFDKKENEQ